MLTSPVAFDLMEESHERGGFDATAIGLASGALIYFATNRAVDHAGSRHRKPSKGQQAGRLATAVTIGALRDGIPKSAAIGISLIGGGAIGLVPVVSVFLFNVPVNLSAAVGKKKRDARRRMCSGCGVRWSWSPP